MSQITCSMIALTWWLGSYNYFMELLRGIWCDKGVLERLWKGFFKGGRRKYNKRKREGIKEKKKQIGKGVVTIQWAKKGVGPQRKTIKIK